MARPPSFRDEMERYLMHLETKQVSKRYYQENRRVLKKIHKLLMEGKRHTRPRQITFEDLMYLKDAVGGRPRNKEYHIDILRLFLNFVGNKQPKPPISPDVPNRPRITPMEYDTILEELNDIGNDFNLATAKVMVLLGGITIRRIGQLRLKTCDIHTDHIDVCDKGRGGGKWRRISITPDIYQELQHYMDFRRMKIQEAIKKCPGQKIPETLLIWVRDGGRIGEMNRSTYDNRMNKVSQITGVKVTAHRLRRCAIKELDSVADKNETSIVMSISGHSSEREFRKYLGDFEDEQTDLMTRLMRLRKDRVYQKVQFAI